METIDEKIPKLEKSKKEWRELLEKDAYRVLFEDATERSFSSPLDGEKRAGTFVCAACYLPLFESKTKFDSGTGWPSFYQPIPGRLDTKRDFKLLWPRTEYHCVRCGGHQGAYIQRRASADRPSDGATTVLLFGSSPIVKSCPLSENKPGKPSLRRRRSPTLVQRVIRKDEVMSPLSDSRNKAGHTIAGGDNVGAVVEVRGFVPKPALSPRTIRLGLDHHRPTLENPSLGVHFLDDRRTSGKRRLPRAQSSIGACLHEHLNGPSEGGMGSPAWMWRRPLGLESLCSCPP